MPNFSFIVNIYRRGYPPMHSTSMLNRVKVNPFSSNIFSLVNLVAFKMNIKNVYRYTEGNTTKQKGRTEFE